MSDTKNWVKPYNTLGKVDIFEDLPNRYNVDELGLLFTEAYREEFRREAALNSERKNMSDKNLGDYTLKEAAMECARRKDAASFQHCACWRIGENMCPFWNTFVCRDLKPHEWLTKLAKDEAKKDHSN